MAFTIRPLHDRVMIKRLEDDVKKHGSIIIPDTAAEKPMKGEVLAVGKGKIRKDGTRQELTVKAGDKIVFSKWAGDEFEYDGQKFLILSEDDILAVIS
ncbi:MAG: co-chaperone GroES [candidate division KSB1 bacterium]|nr:co-chaperone GroES [candidate division KSB1 bacterium]MDZ7274745.1 co-chaperone GroES [candidate division KSB1 bacterium]MDZ7285570.1 co-chaperone GroES [candidate division KSB1 bacterium]MDZ7298602.1 co-chaperone GroES [candidate division KSB1 bacterium]MDZ7306781.1 co-chaperone GroES [candidate division KSB1 bacterium]